MARFQENDPSTCIGPICTQLCAIVTVNACRAVSRVCLATDMGMSMDSTHDT